MGKNKINKNLLLVFGTTFIFLSTLFYWYEWRPRQIRKECAVVEVYVGPQIEQSATANWPGCDTGGSLVLPDCHGKIEAQTGRTILREVSDKTYKNCLRHRGLKY